MEKDLQYYLRLNYSVEIEEIPLEEGGGFLAKIPLLVGCMSDGETLQEAYDNIKEAKTLWLEDMLARGMFIPEPDTEEKYSGKFLVRIPKSLHKIISEQSKREGLSLNQYVANSLAFMAGQKI
ncbi:MAG: toxin-antitoxin system HicB family antitoxin [Phascolarctobacterium sp.]|nr:toxin-antitoxin system HicB family antitoxin [Phascolarctobacterium sp.]